MYLAVVMAERQILFSVHPPDSIFADKVHFAGLRRRAPLMQRNSAVLIFAIMLTRHLKLSRYFQPLLATSGKFYTITTKYYCQAFGHTPSPSSHCSGGALEGAELPLSYSVKMLGVLVKALALLSSNLCVSIQVATDHDVNPHPSVRRKIVPAVNLANSPYPEWAHYHW